MLAAGATPAMPIVFRSARMVLATSSTFGQAAYSALGMASRLAGVSMIEGATAFGRVPSFATSSASAPAASGQAAAHARAIFNEATCTMIGFRAGLPFTA